MSNATRRQFFGYGAAAAAFMTIGPAVASIFRPAYSPPPLFHWAYVDEADSTFDVTRHAREDEKIIALHLERVEGDVPHLSLFVRYGYGQVRNSKPWGHLSYRDFTKPNGEILPLFFGRLSLAWAPMTQPYGSTSTLVFYGVEVEKSEINQVWIHNGDS